MGQKIFSFFLSIGVIILGVVLSQNTNRIFYGLVIAGILYGIYDLYSIITNKQKTEKEQEIQKKLSEQKNFKNEVSSKKIIEKASSDEKDINNEYATIVVHHYKDKMGFGAIPVYVNGKEAGTIIKGTNQVTYYTNVPYNVINMGVYKTEVELSPGDTVEYYVAGNGIQNDRTKITKNEK
jgi:hypothetical protein